MMEFRVLIADGLEGKGQSILRGGAVVEDRPGITPADLLEAVAGFDALVIATRTKVIH